MASARGLPFSLRRFQLPKSNFAILLVFGRVAGLMMAADRGCRRFAALTSRLYVFTGREISFRRGGLLTGVIQGNGCLAKGLVMEYRSPLMNSHQRLIQILLRCQIQSFAQAL